MLTFEVMIGSSGAVKTTGCEQMLYLGYSKNRGVYRLHVTADGEWEEMAIRCFWHLPDGTGPAAILVEDGMVDVPASVTAVPGIGCITFEGSNGTRTITSSDLRYRVRANAGTEDGSLPEPGTPAWEAFLKAHPSSGTTLTIGTVESGETADASIKDGKLNLILPKGEKGERGADGLPGAKGDPGPAGEKGENGAPGTGLDDSAREALMILLKTIAAQTDATQNAYKTLQQLWGSTEEDTDGLVYRLEAPKAFAPANKECIDTGIRMFASIDPKPSYTILFEVQYGESISAKGSTWVLLHCMEESGLWPGFVVQVVGDGSLQTNIYGGKAGFASMSVLKGRPYKFAVRISGTTATRWQSAETKSDFTISNYNTTVDKSLIVGCYQQSDGTKGRFFDGTLYQCLVYNKALTDEQIETWLKG